MSFIFKITTTTSPQTFVIPCVDEGTFNATVDYGDGTGSQTVTAYNDSNLTHSFATAGQYTITIDGTFPNIRFYDDAASRVLVNEVVDLGDVGWVNFYRAFRGCSSLTTFNVGTVNTSSATNMLEMFRDCSSLTTLDLSGFDTSSVTDISRMFINCSSLTTLDLSNFNTSSVTSMQSMFNNCSSLTTLNVSSFDTSSVSNMNNMFNNCSSLTSLNVSNFDTSSVTSMQQMFLNCTSLTSLDLSSFDTSSVTSMIYMFLNCTSLTTLDVSKFDTSSVTDISRMFLNCTSLTNLDIKHFDISSVTNGTSFLQNANNALTTAAYDELLEAWAAQDVQPNVAWHFGDAQYTVETISDWYSPRSASSLSIINNKLVSIADSTAVFGAAQQVDNLIVGNVYKMKARSTCNNAAATMFLSVSVDATLSPSVIFTQGTSTALIDNLFTATATTMYFGVVVSGHAANDTVTIDAGITVKEVTNYTEANAASEIEYSQENVFGSELVVNGDFSNSTANWLSNGTSILSVVNGVMEIDRNGGQQFKQCYQDITTIIGKNYIFNADIIYKTNSINIYIDGVEVAEQWDGASLFFTATSTTTEIGIYPSYSIDATAKIDNVSVKEITNAVEYKNIPQSARELYSLEDDTWVGSNELVVNGDFDTDSDWVSVNDSSGAWSISGGLANVNCTSNAIFKNLGAVIKTGTFYLVSYELKNHVSGSVRVVMGSGTGDFQSTNGIHSQVIQGVASTLNIRFEANFSAGFHGSIDNVSVKEIIEVAS